jgi:hypothetical protein
MVPQPDAGVLQYSRIITFLKKKVFCVPNESPVCWHRPVLVQPALGTQEFSLQAVITSDLPNVFRFVFIFVTTAAGEEKGVVVPGEE